MHTHRLALHVKAAHSDGARVRPQQTGDYRDERRLTGTVRPEESQDLAGRKLKIDAGERLDVVVRLAHVLDLEHLRGSLGHG